MEGLPVTGLFWCAMIRLLFHRLFVCLSPFHHHNGRVSRSQRSQRATSRVGTGDRPAERVNQGPNPGVERRKGPTKRRATMAEASRFVEPSDRLRRQFFLSMSKATSIAKNTHFAI